MSASTYHHGNLRQALVEAAVEAARRGGPDSVALRELARTVGVSHSAAYRHFSDREELVAEVAGAAMGELVEAMRRGVARADGVEQADPVLRARRRLVAIGEAYIDFALAEAGLFRIAFATRGDIAPLGADVDSPFGLLGAVLDQLVEVGYLSVEAREGADVTCWSAVHGFATIHLDGPLAGADPEWRSQTRDQLMIAIDRSYAASSGTAIGPDDDIFARPAAVRP